MERFQHYASRIIAGLGKPDQIIEKDQKSKLEEILTSDLEELIAEDGSWEQAVLERIEPKNFDKLIKTEQKKLDPFEKEDIENGILVSGIEALAFYKSIHFKSKTPFHDKWGIFIFDHALKYLSEEISDFYQKKFNAEQCAEKAFQLLYFHERFHFRFDCWALSQESTTCKFPQVMGKPLYENYINNFYWQFHPLWFVVEESLANLHALSSLKSYGIHAYAKQFMLCQPGAYSNIIGIDRDDFKSRLAAQLFQGPAQILSGGLPEHIPFLANPKDSSLDAECPIYIIHNISASQFVSPVKSLPTVSEIENKFLKKYLNGKEKKRTDHKYFMIDNGEVIKCPNPHYKNVKLNEFNNIVKKSGLTISEYFDERNNTKKWKMNVPRKITKPSLLRGIA